MFMICTGVLVVGKPGNLPPKRWGIRKLAVGDTDNVSG
jgi:hypothetical protein